MTIPSSNILSQALSVIGTNAAQYYAFLSRTTNDIGLDVTLYAAPVELRASFQAVPRKMYIDLGLDFQKSYLMAYAQTCDVSDIIRDTSGDQITIFGKTWQSESKTNWFPIDGWNGILFVMIGDETPNYLCGVPESGGTANEYIPSIVDQSHTGHSGMLSNCEQWISRIDNFENTQGGLSVEVRGIDENRPLGYTIYINGLFSVSGSINSTTLVTIFDSNSPEYANPCAIELHFRQVSGGTMAEAEYTLFADLVPPPIAPPVIP